MYRNSDSSRDRLRKGGFTVIEVMIATTIAGFVSVGVISFYLTMFKVGFVNQERNRINADMRGLTGQLIRDGRQSNYFVMYPSIGEGDHDEADDRVLDGDSGDVLMFVYTVDSAGSLAPDRIERIVCYFRSVSPSGDPLSPVKRYEESFTPASESAVEDLVPTESDLVLADEVVELSQGLADGRLFYNFWGRSVMVNGQIHHGNAAKRVTETYNFTVSPRG